MASDRRLLYPYLSNLTTNCTDWCTSGDCYGIPCSPPPIEIAPSTTPIEIVSKNSHIPTLIIIVAAVLATSFLVLTYFGVLLKKRSNRRRRRTVQGPSHPNNPDDEEGEEEETHHVWYIRTVGLDETTIDSISICVYKRGEGLIEGTDCSVCLSEFRDGELVRLLPKCSHAFHISCIDTWLKSHVSCPLCRAPIVSPAVGPSNPSSSSAAAPVDPSSSADTSTGENSNLPPSESNWRVSAEGTEDGIGESGTGLVVGPEYTSSIFVSGFQVQSNLGDGSGNKLDDPVAVDVTGDAGLQPVRRSVSMDSSSLGSLLFGVESGGSFGVDRKKPNFKEGLATKNMVKLESCSKGASLPKGPIGMERSLSSSGGKFYLSRYGRGRNSILPL